MGKWVIVYAVGFFVCFLLTLLILYSLMRLEEELNRITDCEDMNTGKWNMMSTMFLFCLSFIWPITIIAYVVILCAIAYEFLKNRTKKRDFHGN